MTATTTTTTTDTYRCRLPPPPVAPLPSSSSTTDRTAARRHDRSLPPQYVSRHGVFPSASPFYSLLVSRVTGRRVYNNNINRSFSLSELGFIVGYRRRRRRAATAPHTSHSFVRTPTYALSRPVRIFLFSTRTRVRSNVVVAVVVVCCCRSSLSSSPRPSFTSVGRFSF